MKLPATGYLTGRAVEEWIGKTPDSIPPPHVRDRIWLRCEGKCHITGRKIRPGEKWHLDHIIPLKDGGENRESNLAPALEGKHLEKTAEENSERADVSRKRQKHNGISRAKKKIPSRPFRQGKGNVKQLEEL